MSKTMAIADVTIYHNPRCSKSRQTLDLLRQNGITPRIVEYLKNPPNPAELKRILRLLGLDARQLLREKDAREAGIDAANASEDSLIAAMIRNPATIERPIVVTAKGAAIGRPPEAVLRIL